MKIHGQVTCNITASRLLSPTNTRHRALWLKTSRPKCCVDSHCRFLATCNVQNETRAGIYKIMRLFGVILYICVPNLITLETSTVALVVAGYYVPVWINLYTRATGSIRSLIMVRFRERLNRFLFDGYRYLTTSLRPLFVANVHF